MPTITRRRTMGLAAGMAASLAMPHVARAAIRQVKLGLSNNLVTPFGRGAIAFGAAVAADPIIGKLLRIEVHPNAALGDDPSVLKGCIGGTVDMALIAGSIMSNVVTELAVLNAPFLFREVAQARAFLDGPMGDDFKALARKRDVHVLAWGENGIRQITAGQPVRTPSDLKGLKIRVPQSDIMLGGFRALGAAATPLSWSLVRDAIVRGEVQAQENSIATIEASKIYEVQSHLSLTSHIYDAAGFLCSGDLLEDLGTAERDALIACARQGAALTRTLCQEADREGVARLRAAGMTVVENVDFAAFRASARPFLQGLDAKYGADRVSTLLDPNG